MAASPSVADDVRVDLGTPVPESQTAARSITIFPDGRGLPRGRGSVTEGAALYRARCESCHGGTGTEGPTARLAGPDGYLPGQTSPLLAMSVGARWPYATTIFDFVRRAMPHTAPKSLTNNEVYAVTAYLLYLNGLVDESATLDRASLPRIRMPARAHLAPTDLLER